MLASAPSQREGTTQLRAASGDHKRIQMKTKLTLLLTLILLASARAQVQVLPPDFTLFGKTSGEYLAELDQYIQPLSTNEDYLLPKAVPSATDRVYFLQRPSFNLAPPVGIQSYFIPDDVYVFFPLAYYTFDNIGNDPLWTIAQLREAVASVVDNITGLHATIDGVALTNLLDHRTETPVYSVFYPTNDNIITVLLRQPFEGLDDPVVGGGYPLMLAPLPVGVHDFRTGAAIGGVIDLKYERHFQIHVFHANHPPVADASATRSRVISPNNHNAEVVLDGSRSSDPDNDTLAFSWVEEASTLALAVISTNILSLGTHLINLVVSDGQLNATNMITVDVITPCQAVAELTSLVEAAHLIKKQTRSLAGGLLEACAAFEHAFQARHPHRAERLEHALHELVEFQNEAQAELGRRDPALAALLTTGAQEIIDALIEPHRAHQRHEDEEDDHE